MQIDPFPPCTHQEYSLSKMVAPLPGCTFQLRTACTRLPAHQNLRRHHHDTNLLGTACTELSVLALHTLLLHIPSTVLFLSPLALDQWDTFCTATCHHFHCDTCLLYNQYTCEHPFYFDIGQEYTQCTWSVLVRCLHILQDSFYIPEQWQHLSLPKIIQSHKQCTSFVLAGPDIDRHDMQYKMLALFLARRTRPDTLCMPSRHCPQLL